MGYQLGAGVTVSTGRRKNLKISLFFALKNQFFSMHIDDVGTCAKLYDRMIHVHVASSKCTIVKMIYDSCLGKISVAFAAYF